MSFVINNLTCTCSFLSLDLTYVIIELTILVNIRITKNRAKAIINDLDNYSIFFFSSLISLNSVSQIRHVISIYIILLANGNIVNVR